MTLNGNSVGPGDQRMSVAQAATRNVISASRAYLLTFYDKQGLGLPV
jgi:hypothetical protein